MKRLILATAAAAALLLPAHPAAASAPKLDAGLGVYDDRLWVIVTPPRTFTPRTRPKSIEVSVAGASYTLKPESGDARRSDWLSRKLSPRRVSSLWGRKARIRIGTRSGVVELRRPMPPEPAQAVP